MSEFSMPERLSRLRSLAKEHGGTEHIPDEALAGIDYVRFRGEDETTRLLPVEKLAGLSVAQYMQEAKDSYERRFRPPIGHVSFSTETTRSYGTKVAAHRINRLVKDIQYELDADLIYLEKSFNEHGAVEFGFTGREVAGTTDDGDILLFPSILPTLGTVTDTAIEQAAAATGSDLSGVSIQELGRLIGAEDYAEHYTPEQSEQMWRTLEMIKSHVCDTEEIEKVLEREFTFIDNGQYDFRPQAAVRFEHGGRQYDVSMGYHPDNFGFHLSRFQNKLTEHGFADTAMMLQGTHSFAGVRKILAEAMTASEKLKDLKSREKALKASRRSMRDQDEIHQFNRDLNLLKAERRDAARLLRAMYDYFDLARMFAEKARREIERVQELLTFKQSGPSIAVGLDPFRDAGKDADPGALSGDCTAGKPLPFALGIGFHNVKVHLDGEHAGNIYLLDTTDETGGKKVWHLEAVQVPNAAIDWDTFAGQLVEGMLANAQSDTPDMITINAKPHLISNYDYIGNAFLRYAGADTADHAYSQMELPETVDYSAEQGLTAVDIAFPSYDTDIYTAAQGMNSRQLVIWQKETKKK